VNIRILEEHRINLISLEFPPIRGGAGVYCDELSTAASEIGFPVTLWVPQGSKTLSTGMQINELPFRGSQGWACSLRLILFLRHRLNANSFVHLAEPAALLAFIRFGWLIRQPLKFIITIHGSELIRFGKIIPEKFFFRQIIMNAEAIHVLSLFNQKNLLARFPFLEKNKVHRVPGAPARAITKEADVKRKNVNKKQSMILCVGRIHPRKGQLELLEAIEQFSLELKSKLTCHFVGPFTHRNYYEKVKERARSSGCAVLFHGDQQDSELLKFYQSADIFALTPILQPKSVEGFGFVYLEASFHGLPIIGHKVGGVEDAVRNGETGFLLDPSNKKGLASALQRLIEDEDLRRSLGEKGREWAANHSWQKVAEKIYAVSG